jgi:hypothetical protein
MVYAGRERQDEWVEPFEAVLRHPLLPGSYPMKEGNQ